MQNKKAAIEDFETRLASLKEELKSAFVRQEVIEARKEAREKISKELKEGESQPLVWHLIFINTYHTLLHRTRKEASTKARR